MPASDRATKTLKEARKTVDCPIPSKFLHVDTEDLNTISPSVFQSKVQPLQDSKSYLHVAIAINKTMGSGVRRVSLDPKDKLNFVHGRLDTYPEDWGGYARREMALAGLYFENDEIICFWCGITFRDMNDQSQCPWMRHKEVAPYCGHLKRTMTSGPRPTPAGKRVRHFSESAVERMVGSGFAMERVVESENAV